MNVDDHSFINIIGVGCKMIISKTHKSAQPSEYCGAQVNTIVILGHITTDSVSNTLSPKYSKPPTKFDGSRPKRAY